MDTNSRLLLQPLNEGRSRGALNWRSPQVDHSFNHSMGWD